VNPSEIKPATFRLVAQCNQPTASPRTPMLCCSRMLLLLLEMR